MYYVLWLGLFLFLLSWFLVRDFKLHHINQSVWKTFLIILPYSIWLSPFFAGIAAATIAMFQLFVQFIPRLPRTLQWYGHFLRAAVIDLIAVAAFLIFFRKRCLLQVPSFYPGTGEVPILLIHGYRHDRGAWVFHGPRLAKKNLGPLYTIDLGSSFRTIQNYSTLIQEKVAEIFKDTGKKELILVGYSMGGLVATDYAVNKAIPGTIKALITMGSPLNGTVMANLGPEACARQMRYRNPFVLNLQQSMSNLPFPFTQIGSTSDTTIIPQSSAFITAETLPVDSMGHLEMLYSDRMTEKLSKLLTIQKNVK